MAKFTFEIDVYSDPICPWCYLGSEALDRAIAAYTAQHPDVDFKLTWKPYLLWPNAGVSSTLYMSKCCLFSPTPPRLLPPPRPYSDHP